MLVYWLWLATRRGIGERLKRKALQHFGTPEDIYYAEATSYRYVEGMTRRAAEGLCDKDLTKAKAILSWCTREQIHILTYGDAAYPENLKAIDDPPIVLYYKGTLPNFEEKPFIGVVGTRRSTPYGLEMAGSMGYQIARCGGIVVSGLAEGIDAVAMNGALNAGGYVIGVLGCGIDIIYPSCNSRLYAMTEKNGCILSEFPPGTPPIKTNFPKRNRIISGMSSGVLVVEAHRISGALITARAALAQGRDVFVVPGNVGQESNVGSNSLLREGAYVAMSGWDVMREYASRFPGAVTAVDFDSPKEKALAMVAQNAQLPDYSEDKKAVSEKIIIDNGETTTYSDVEKSLPPLSDDEQAVVMQLKQGSRLADDVMANCGVAAGKILAVLTMLEVKGVIQRLPGNRLSLK